MIQETIFSVITGNSEFSSRAQAKLFPLRIPQRVQLPAAVYQVISKDPVNSLEGDSNLDAARIQITCWAERYSDAQALARAVRQALVSSAQLKVITESSFDTEDPETKAYGVILDFRVWEEVVPLTLYDLLLETGDFMLLETGDKIVLEV